MPFQDLNNSGDGATGGYAELNSGEENPAVTRSDKKFGLANKGNLLLASVLIAGLVAVYLLSLRKGPEPAAASQQQQAVETNVDSALKRLEQLAAGNPDDRNSAAALVKTFCADASQFQVPVDQLAGNPFVFKMPTPPPPGNPGAGTPTPVVQGELRELSQAMGAVKKLSLQSVLMGSPRATATISNNLLAEGQKICGWTVSKILPREVVLTWKDRTYVLTMPR